MPKEKRGRGTLARGVLVASVLALATSACTTIAGGVALAGLVAIGALTSRCYDYLDVTVLDADGRKTCAATVTASKGGSPLELSSCYYTPLTDGRWTLRASLPGFPDALSTVVVDHAHDCTRNVQTLELTMKRAGAPLTPSVTARPAAPAASAASAAPAAPPAPASPTPSAEPATEPRVPEVAPPPATSALPANSAAPPVGVFPEH